MTQDLKLEFCQAMVKLDGRPIRFDGRPYLPQILAHSTGNLVLRCSRQVEKSTFLLLTILYLAVVYAGIKILFVCPREQQASVFVKTRLLPVLNTSPILRRALRGNSRQPLPVKNLQFANGSQLFVRAAYRSADAARGLSADVLMLDEFQDLAPGALGVLQETLSHSHRQQIFLTGTPKTIDNPLEAMFAQSTANEWTTTCTNCQYDVIPEERALGPTGLECPQCHSSIDIRLGRWVARNPDATWGAGYWIGHPMVPWVNYDEILERQKTYDLACFKNEVLGLPTALGELILTRAELEACCTDRQMAQSWKQIPAAYRYHVIAGVDWGGGSKSRTVVVVGFMRPDSAFEICHFARFRADEDPQSVCRQVADVCRRFGVRWIGADGGGNGHVYNRLLLDALGEGVDLYAILYSAEAHEPRQDGILWKWTVGRTASIGYLISRIKKQKVDFPRIADCGTYLDEFCCETAVYDDYQHSVKYTHPETLPDDALHATNYALLIGRRGFPQIAQLDES